MWCSYYVIEIYQMLPPVSEVNQILSNVIEIHLMLPSELRMIEKLGNIHVKSQGFVELQGLVV